MKKQVVLVGILLAAIITSVIGLEQQSALARTSSEDRHVGFSDGCKGVPLMSFRSMDLNRSVAMSFGTNTCIKRAKISCFHEIITGYAAVSAVGFMLVLAVLYIFR